MGVLGNSFVELTDYECCRFSGGVVMVSIQLCPGNGREHGADGSDSRSHVRTCTYTIAYPCII